MIGSFDGVRKYDSQNVALKKIRIGMVNGLHNTFLTFMNGLYIFTHVLPPFQNIRCSMFMKQMYLVYIFE
jgi:hypothetical protein